MPSRFRPTDDLATVAETDPDGLSILDLSLHKGQDRALRSRKRFTLVLSGTQSGKTIFGPWWLYYEIADKGPGDYLVVGAYSNLLQLKVMPAFLRVFKTTFDLGEYVGSPVSVFRFRPDAVEHLCGVPGEVNVFFGHAGNPETLESATAKAAWLDEAGQRNFRLGSWEAIQRRLSIHQGRVLITTTPYDLGWLKQQLYDPWVEARQDHDEIEVINFRSIDNPAFPPEEYYRAMRTLPTWKFLMFYDGKFTRPAGLIYDNFDPKRHTVPRFAIPANWQRFAGLDFGAVNTAAVYLAEERSPTTNAPTGRFILYREYPDRTFLPGRHAASAHAVRMLKGEPTVPLFVGGAASEDEWRAKFRDAGIPVAEPPIDKVEPQIESVYAMIAGNQLIVMDDCVGVLDQLASYSRELDEQGEATERIDNDQLFHLLAATRYLCAWLVRGGLAGWQATVAPEKSLTAQVPADAFGVPDRDAERREGRIGTGSLTANMPSW